MNDIDLDFERLGRIGMPEIVYGQHKAPEHLRAIAEAHAQRRANLLITRCSAEQIEGIDGTYDAIGRTLLRMEDTVEPIPGLIGIVSAGTSDAPIAHEVATTLSYLGCRSQAFGDCGVAGLQRLLKHIDALSRCHVLIAIAGFEAAITTVLAGLVPQPIIGVPTSVGYGVAEGGRAALSSMLASCAGGVTVVNIDNGVGAAMAARRLLQAQAAAGTPLASEHEAPEMS